MLKIEGTIPARPNTFNCSDLAKNAIKIVKPKVAPEQMNFGTHQQKEY